MSDLPTEQLREELEALRQENARLRAAEAEHARRELEIAQLNQDLQHRVAELQTLLEVLPVAIGIAEDPQCRHIRTNPAFARLLSLPPDANASKTAPKKEKPTTFRVCRNGTELPDRELPMQVAAAQSVEVRDFEEEVVWNDGTSLSLVAYAAPLFDAQGKVRGSVGAFMDITERKRAVAALRESEARYRTLVEHAPEAIVVLDVDTGRFVEANENAVTLFQRDRATLLTLGPLEVSPAMQADGRASVESAPEKLEAALKGETPHFEWLHSDAAGRAIPCEVRLVRLPAAGRRLIRGNIYDITERKRLEEQLLQAQKLESLGRLAGGVAHDFNNMLTAIQGFAELAEEELPPDSATQKPLQNIRVAVKRAADLTSQLLAFARRQVIAPKVVSLNTLIQEISPLLRRLIGEHIEMLVLTQPDLGRVRIDPGQFGQILINLAINGRDAMPDGGRLIIETANVTLDAEYASRHAGVVPGEYVKLTVSDTGMGISPDVQEHIFEPFFTTKELGRGTGMGLASCYGIVQQNGGHIWVYSEPGRSTTFTIYLPCVDAAESSPSENEAAPSILPRGTETILLAEDEEIVRDFAALTLRGLGYTVLVAGDGGEALQRAAEQEGEIHLLLTDVVMPQMSGMALAERLHASRPNLRVLYTSGYTENTIVQHGVLKPGIAFLHKPYTTATLAQRVRQVLEAEATGGPSPPERGDRGVEHRSH